MPIVKRWIGFDDGIQHEYTVRPRPRLSVDRKKVDALASNPKKLARYYKTLDNRRRKWRDVRFLGRIVGFKLYRNTRSWGVNEGINIQSDAFHWRWKPNAAWDRGIIPIFVGHDGKRMRATDFAWENFGDHAGDTVPDGWHAFPTCGDPYCVRPLHCELRPTYHAQRKLSEEQRAAIRASTQPVKDLVAEYGVSKSLIYSIRSTDEQST